MEKQPNIEQSKIVEDFIKTAREGILNSDAEKMMTVEEKKMSEEREGGIVEMQIEAIFDTCEKTEDTLNQIKKIQDKYSDLKIEDIMDKLEISIQDTIEKRNTGTKGLSDKLDALNEIKNLYLEKRAEINENEKKAEKKSKLIEREKEADEKENIELTDKEMEAAAKLGVLFDYYKDQKSIDEAIPKIAKIFKKYPILMSATKDVLNQMIFDCESDSLKEIKKRFYGAESK